MNEDVNKCIRDAGVHTSHFMVFRAEKRLKKKDRKKQSKNKDRQEESGVAAAVAVTMAVTMAAVAGTKDEARGARRTRRKMGTRRRLWKRLVLPVWVCGMDGVSGTGQLRECWGSQALEYLRRQSHRCSSAQGVCL